MTPDSTRQTGSAGSPDAAPGSARPTSRTSRRGRLVLFALFAALISLALCLAVGEIALRIYFHGGGVRTLGGPGGGDFETLMRKGRYRATVADWPKEPGFQRLMIQGDSISWGLGVRDWKHIYANLLLDRLNRDGAKFELALIADPGREIDGHLQALRRFAPVVRPDLIVYQWYVNDIELTGRRPDSTRAWQRWRGHATLKSWSYLYYFLDWRFSTLLPAPVRSYTQYLLEDYVEGGQPWSDFLAFFHSWAVNAAVAAPRRILMLYPTLPFSGTYPLQAINDRMEALAGPHTYRIPVWTLPRLAGNSVDDADSTYGDVRRLRAGEPGGWLFSGRGIAMARGTYVATVRVRLDENATGRLGRLDVVCGEGKHVIGQLDLDAGSFQTPGQWRDVSLLFEVDEPIVQDLEFRFEAEAGAPVSFDTISVDVDYGLEVVDPIDRLKVIDTRASIFDAHPNEHAHRILADVLTEAIERKR